MAAKIYSAPDSIKKPAFDFSDTKAYFKAEAEYVDRLKQFAKDQSLSKAKPADREYIGEEIRFPVADGYARYIVYSLSPVTLIHIDTCDGWQFQYANRLTAKDVKREVDHVKALERLFASQGGK